MKKTLSILLSLLMIANPGFVCIVSAQQEIMLDGITEFSLTEMLINEEELLTNEEILLENLVVQPLSITTTGTDLIWERTDTGQSSKCVSIGKISGAGTLNINWGDGTTDNVIANTYPSFNSVCHSYASLGLYEVHITNPEDVGYLGIYSQQVSDFWGGNVIHLKNLSLRGNESLSTFQEGSFDDLTNLINLNLSNNTLSNLPEGIFDNLVNLIDLDLGSNELTTLPAIIFDHLPNLEQLLLGTNRLTILPEGIFDHLTNLNYLDLSENTLTTLPEGIFDNLVNLIHLNLYNNELSTLPEGVFDHLTNIMRLYLGNNKLTSLSEGIFDHLTNIMRLYLGNNKLTSLSERVFDHLPNLFSLTLGENNLASLPEGTFDNLPNLRYLYLYMNELTSLPVGIFDHLPNLNSLDLRYNKLSSFPERIFENLQNLWYIYLDANCLDRNLIDADTIASIENLHGNFWSNNQFICAIVDYTPKTPTTGDVEAFITFVGNPTRVANFLSSNPGLETGHNFMANGSYTFDYSSVNTIADLLTPIVNSEVDWIFSCGVGEIWDGSSCITPPTPPSGGGGGGSSIKQKDHCPNGDYSSSYYDDECGIAPKDGEEENTEEYGSGENTEEEKEEETNPEIVGEKTEEELLYEWAKEYKLTDASSLEEMRLTDRITRAEMAKLISRYSENIRNVIPDQTKESCNTFNDLETAPKNLQKEIVKSCQLGLMGYYSDGETQKEAFTPNEVISRAEVATVISRMLRGNANKGSEEWRYQNHLLALRKKNIIQQDIDPMTKELRENVFLMLSRI